MTFGDYNFNNSISLNWSEKNHIFAFNISNNKADKKIYNYGFKIKTEAIDRLNCKLKYEKATFKFITDTNEYPLDYFSTIF